MIATKGMRVTRWGTEKGLKEDAGSTREEGEEEGDGEGEGDAVSSMRRGEFTRTMKNALDTLCAYCMLTSRTITQIIMFLVHCVICALKMLSTDHGNVKRLVLECVDLVEKRK